MKTRIGSPIHWIHWVVAQRVVAVVLALSWVPFRKPYVRGWAWGAEVERHEPSLRETEKETEWKKRQILKKPSDSDGKQIESKKESRDKKKPKTKETNSHLFQPFPLGQLDYSFPEEEEEKHRKRWRQRGDYRKDVVPSSSGENLEEDSEIGKGPAGDDGSRREAEGTEDKINEGKNEEEDKSGAADGSKDKIKEHPLTDLYHQMFTRGLSVRTNIVDVDRLAKAAEGVRTDSITSAAAPKSGAA
ncbi:MAG: hypothetical protein LBI29_03980, partial [Rickettsiales bacterium]|nr:hypothetical protein [Rickettsiales bacterium]